MWCIYWIGSDIWIDLEFIQIESIENKFLD